MKISDIVFGQWTMALVYTMLWSATAFAGIEDKVLRFSTPGPDRYADGSIVADGECYALVWSPKGSTFSGFNADGTPVSSNDRVVLAAPLAQNGKCRDCNFQVPSEEYEELAGGEWAVCLVDTRMANGIPAGVQDSKPLRVNRWGAVNSGVKIEPASASNLTAPASAASVNKSQNRLMAATSGDEADGEDGVQANTVSAVPASVKNNPPKITRINVLDNGEVVLEVEDTVPFLSYTIISGSEPGNLQEDSCSEVVDGKTGAKITIGTAQSAASRFFKVTRAK